MKLSIIIPHCNEYQNLFMTVESLFMQFRRDPELLSQVEIIVVDNRSSDMSATPIDPTAATHHVVQIPHRTRMTEQLQAGWLAKVGILRVIIYDAEQSHWKARQAGLDIARGEYVMFCDAHVLHEPGSLQFGVQILDACPAIGQVHGGQNYFFASPDRVLYQYRLRLEEKFWGDWTSETPNFVDRHTPFKIPMSSQAAAFYRKAELEEWGGFPDKSGIYGGNEAFMAMRTWMMGKQVWCDPRMEYHHLADTRGYQVNNRDLRKNFMLAAYLLGGEAWLDRLYDTLKADYAPMYYHELDWARDVCLACHEERAVLMNKVHYSLDEVIDRKPWLDPPTSQRV